MNSSQPDGFTAASTTAPVHALRAGMVGQGMIWDETYRPFFDMAARRPLFNPLFGACDVDLVAIASRTGLRAERYRQTSGARGSQMQSFVEPGSVPQLLRSGNVNFVCIATPDDRHFDACRLVLAAGKHLLVEKPSVLKLSQLEELNSLAEKNDVLAKVVYHKLFDPDHKKLRTLVADEDLRHVNNGYCSLLEPKSISENQFSEWISGRNPGTYVAVHYIKLIDFTFGGRLKTVHCNGQRGLVGPTDGDTWDSVQLRLTYEYADAREATFDIHTSWVTPDNFPGYVEQEVQFRFDNGVWLGDSRRRGVELTIEDRTPSAIKTSLNNHFATEFVEPWGERRRRGYGIEAIARFAHEVAHVEFGGAKNDRSQRLRAMRELAYNDLSADRQVVAAVEAMEAILAAASSGTPDCFVRVEGNAERLLLFIPGKSEPRVLHS
ncbi:MAG: Gfo/Idh/MocA family oxidoreductase [Pirellulales bacterium]|nr:Gfo/Idh/MocA family oxidoreductase [Pirellulales bacterium]